MGGDDALTSPFAPDAGRAFAMNSALENRRLVEIGEEWRTVLLFECGFGSPPAGGRELLPETPRGRKGYVICFADGHVETVSREEVEDLIWEP